jgi:hypothetical protein
MRKHLYAHIRTGSINMWQAIWVLLSAFTLGKLHFCNNTPMARPGKLRTRNAIKFVGSPSARQGPRVSRTMISMGSRYVSTRTYGNISPDDVNLVPVPSRRVLLEDSLYHDI